MKALDTFCINLPWKVSLRLQKPLIFLKLYQVSLKANTQTCIQLLSLQTISTLAKDKSYVSQMKMTKPSDLFTESDTEELQVVFFLVIKYITLPFWRYSKELHAWNLAFMAKDDPILHTKVKSNQHVLRWHVCEPSQPLPDLLLKGNLEPHEKFTQGFPCNVKALPWLF